MIYPLSDTVFSGGTFLTTSYEERSLVNILNQTSEATALQFQLITAATHTEHFFPPWQATRMVGWRVFTAVGPASGESVQFTVSRSRVGVLTEIADITLTDSPDNNYVDADSSITPEIDIAFGDIIVLVITYTAGGGPAPAEGLATKMIFG